MTDEVQLEMASALNSLQQSVAQAALARQSLDKARENEELAIARYNEGKASIIEIIEAQTYRQHAQLNYVQAKMSAQSDYAQMQKVANAY